MIAVKEFAQCAGLWVSDEHSSGVNIYTPRLEWHMVSSTRTPGIWSREPKIYGLNTARVSSLVHSHKSSQLNALGHVHHHVRRNSRLTPFALPSTFLPVFVDLGRPGEGIQLLVSKCARVVSLLRCAGAAALCGQSICPMQAVLCDMLLDLKFTITLKKPLRPPCKTSIPLQLLTPSAAA